jgi:hypothetical protein
MTAPDNACPVEQVDERWPGYSEQSWCERFHELDRRHDLLSRQLQTGLTALARQHTLPPVAEVMERVAKFQLGDEVEKIKGSSWHGRIVGTYSTSLTTEGYCVESSRELGSVQLYPAAALTNLQTGGDGLNERGGSLNVAPLTDAGDGGEKG